MPVSGFTWVASADSAHNTPPAMPTVVNTARARVSSHSARMTFSFIGG